MYCNSKSLSWLSSYTGQRTLIQRTVGSKSLVLTLVMALLLLLPILAHYQAYAASVMDPNKVSDTLPGFTVR
jgi:hypothetical protein